MKNKISKIVMTMLLVVCMAVSMFVVNAFATDSDSTSSSKIDNCETVVKEYDAEKAAEYIAGNNTYPELEGYLFAGWYTTNEIPAEKREALKCVIKNSIPENAETVYALFVKDHVLSVKAQVSANLIDDDITNDDIANGGKAAIRFVTTVDSLVYQEAGLEISYVYQGVTYSAKSVGDTVYEKLYVIGSNEDEWEETPSGLFCGLSSYFRACTITDVPLDAFGIDFHVKPYWITMSGEKVYGVEATKTVEQGCQRTDAYVTSATDSEGNPVGKDLPNYGSFEYPYATLDYAIAHVEDGKTVHIIDSVSINGEDGIGWTAHGKDNVTITGGILDVTTDDLCINDGVTFTNMTLKIAATDVRDFNRIFAEGNHVVIASDVTVSNQEATVQIFGGGMNNDVESTNLEVNAGTYAVICGGSSGKAVTGDTNLLVSGNVIADRIYGGGYSGHVKGNTNVKIGSGVNPSDAYSNEAYGYTYSLYGGGHSGNVYGDVKIDVKDGANFTYIHGGVGGAPEQVGTGVVVEGSIDITFAGKAHGIYGGSLNGSNSHTKICMTGGEVYQIFGGTRKETMEGNTDVRIEGGIVHRRIYGGSYNDYGSTWENPSRQVIGYASVTVSTATGVNLNRDIDRALSALSRYSSAQEDEWGVLIFEDGLYDTYSSKIGSSYFSNLQAYHYLVKASTNGDVQSAGEFLSIEPDSGYVATVYQVVGGEEIEKHYTESDSYYKLPSLNASTDKTEILVKFTEKGKKDFKGYEAKIGGAYYQTLEEAIAAVDKYKNAEIDDLGEAKRLITITTENSQYGTITANKKYCLVEDNEEITITEKELLNTAYYLAGLNINNEDFPLNLDGTYSFTPSVGGEYIIKAIHKKAIYEVVNGNWSLVNQNQNTDEETGVTSGKITLPSGGYGMLYLYRTRNSEGNKGYDYANVDYTLKLKDWGGTDSVTPYTMFEFIFDTDSGEKVYQLRVEEKDGSVQIRNNQPQNNYLVSGSEVHYTFSDAEYASYTGSGVNVRVLREGIKISLYVNDEIKKSIYLPEPLENDDMARVRLQRDGDSKVQIDLEYELLLPERKSMAGKYISILGDSISMSKGIPTNADGTSTAGNNSTTSENNATDIYGADIDQGIGSDWTKLYWGQSMIENGMGLLVNNSVSKGLLHANPHTSTYGNDASQLVHYVPGYQRAGELDADQGTLAGTSPDIIYLYMGTEDRKQSDPIGFEAKYKATLDTLTAIYPEAEIFCFTTMAYFDGGGYRGIGYTSGSSASRMKTVNDAIKKLAYQYENVTLVDIADIITMDNYTTYFPEGVTRVAPNNLAHDEIAARLQRALESQFDKGVAITVKSSEYGTITTDKFGCELGDTFVITAPVASEVAEGYYLAGVTVNGEEVTLDSNRTCSITAKEDAYVIEGIYKKKIFRDDASWDLSQQNQGVNAKGATTGIVTLPSGGPGALWLYRTTTDSYDYGDIDLTLTLRDYAEGKNTPVTQVDFILATLNEGVIEQKVLQLYLEEVNGGVRVGNKEHSNTYKIGSNVFFELNDEEAEKYKADGIKFRVLREGTKISFFVDGVFKQSIYLNYLVETDTNLPANIENDTMARVRIQRAGDDGARVEIPYELSFPEKKSMVGKYISILGDSISMSTEKPTNADGTSTADNNSTTSVNNATDIYGADIEQGISGDWTKLYWGQSLVTNSMNLLVNNSVSKGLLHANPHTNTYGNDASQLVHYVPGYQRAGELDADQGSLAGTAPDIIYIYMGTEDRKQSDPAGFEAKYKATLDTITATYTDAEVFCFTTMAYFDGGGYRGIGYTSGSSAARMKTVNDAVKKLACQYENVTLVDIADIITIDNYTTYFPETVTRVAPNNLAHDEIAARLQKALESQFKAPETTE